MNGTQPRRLLTGTAATIVALLAFAAPAGAQQPNPLCNLPVKLCPSPPTPPPSPAVDPGSPNPGSPNPLVGKRLFMDCEASRQSTAAKYNVWHAVRHNPRYANELRKIAEVPGTKWFAGIEERPTRAVERFFANVDDPQYGGPSCSTKLARGARDAYVGDYPVVAIRRLVNGSCAGMKRVGDEYKAWIDEFIRMSQLTYVPNSLLPTISLPLTLSPYLPVSRIFHEVERYQYWMGQPFPKGRWVKAANREMTIILEPDGIGLMGARDSCLKRSEVPSRLALLAWAAQRLGSTPGMNVYIDAGSSSWLKRGKVAGYLRRAGIGNVRGFALNSTHFNSTNGERRFGDALARSLGTHYVINTAENANGALPKRKWGKYGSAASTCNPRNAGLGTRPTTRTGSPYADAFLWISRPGLSSNGKSGNPKCGREGGPSGNVFYVEHAVRLARQANQATFSGSVWPPPPL